MSLIKPILVAIALATASPAAAQQIVIDPNFRVSSFDWDGNGRTLVMWRPVLIEGKIAICGAYSSRGGRKYSDLSRQAIADMRIDRANGAFLRNLNFFKRASTAAFQGELTGETANCRVTNVAGTAADLSGLQLGFTPQRYRF